MVYRRIRVTAYRRSNEKGPRLGAFFVLPVLHLATLRPGRFPGTRPAL